MLFGVVCVLRNIHSTTVHGLVYKNCKGIKYLLNFWAAMGDCSRADRVASPVIICKEEPSRK